MTDNLEVDEKLLELIMSPIKTAIIVCIAVGVLIDIATFFYRPFASWVVYFEAVYLLLHGFVPYDYGQFQSFVLLMQMIVMFTVSACKLGSSSIICFVTLIILEVVMLPMLYKEQSLTAELVLKRLAIAFICFVILSIYSMVGAYIAQLRVKVSKITLENLGLLDRMYEGLLVLNESDRRPEFASKPVIKILKSVPRDEI